MLDEDIVTSNVDVIIHDYYSEVESSSVALAHQNKEVYGKKSMKMFSATFTRIKQYFPLVLYLLTALCFVPFLWMFSMVIRGIALLILKVMPNYGKMINYYEGLFNENFVHDNPQCSIVTQVTLDGDISAESIRELFTNNVLAAVLGHSGHQIRYPELKQYITTFMGFRVWKNDPHFEIDNHIFERCLSNNNSIDVECGETKLDMGTLHQELCNKKFHKRRSPWDITIIRNASYDSDDNFGTSSFKTILLFRIHHILGDGKSIHKVLVEGLGEKKLNMPAPQASTTTLFQQVVTIVAFPIQYFLFLLDHSYYGLIYHLHPWKCPFYTSTPLIVKFSKRLDLNVIKNASKRHSVACSSVIMSMICGAIQGYDAELAKKGVMTWYILPKENHPPKLTNHMYAVSGILPTNENSLRSQIKKCNDLFMTWKTTNVAMLGSAATMEFGALLHPLTKLLCLNACCLMGITNVAGDRDGFSVGGLQCTEFVQSMGCMAGSSAFVVVIVSYKDSVRFSFIGKSSVFSDAGLEHLISKLEKNFQKLKEVS